MAYVTRKTEDSFAARLMFGVQFIPFAGARDPGVSRQLAEALNRDAGGTVKSLRCDLHDNEEMCWLHGDGWCFSIREPDVVD
jgi:protein-L-isoaspartate(D-aspartate) O-methyltransferase